MEQEVNPHKISEPPDPAQVSDSELATDHDLDEEYSECSSLYYQKVKRKQKAWEDLRELTVERFLQFIGKQVRTNKCIIVVWWKAISSVRTVVQWQHFVKTVC